LEAMVSEPTSPLLAVGSGRAGGQRLSFHFGC
jgi:hypothetical protein